MKWAKMALFCDVDREAVVAMQTAQTIYEVPLLLEDSGVGEYIAQHLGIGDRRSDLSEWRELVNHIKRPKRSLWHGAGRQVHRSARLLHEHR